MLLVGLLLALRLLGWGGVRLFIQEQPLWLQLSFQIPTYLGTAILVWWERYRLADYHLDSLAVAVIILARPAEIVLRALDARSGYGMPYPLWAEATFLLIALGLAIALLADRSRLAPIRLKDFRNFGLGIAVGLLVAILLAYPISLWVRSIGLSYPLARRGALGALVSEFVVQLGWAAVAEEPLFRGFLWGVLRKAGWKDHWAWLLQAFLFWIGHIYYLREFPLSFWLIVPTGALVLGLLAWRTRSLSTSMAAHAAMNSTGLFFATLAARLG